MKGFISDEQGCHGKGKTKIFGAQYYRVISGVVK